MSCRVRTECRACGAGLVPFLDLGAQPLANNLPWPAEAGGVQRYPLVLCRCAGCGLVQLREVVSPDVLFANYLYVPSTSRTMRDHFEALAATAVARLELGPTDRVVDIGSNDGLLLSCFQRRGVAVQGVEPAANLARRAVDAGIPTVEAFFDINVARHLATEGAAALVTATNVFAHVDDIRGFLRAAFELLRPGGVLMVEVQSFADTVNSLAFDMTYHEHLTYYATAPLARLCDREGLALLDVERVNTHGGSLRAYIGWPGHPLMQDTTVEARVEAERDVVGERGCHRLAGGAAEIRERLRHLIGDIRRAGGRVAAYGAPAKATVLLNYCGLGPVDVGYVVDQNPAKQGRLIPGVDVPIVGPERLESDPPTHLLLLAWNLADEIMRDQQAFRAAGGRFLTPIPRPAVVA